MTSATARCGLSSELARAEQCDQAGQHTEAVNWLVAGVGKNDVEALTRLGKRLLIGDRAPHLPRDGYKFLSDAANRGGAEATAVFAVCLAVGVVTLPDLKSAWAYLVTAAARGWEPAQDQIRVLAGDSTWADSRRPPVNAGHWQRTAKDIDLSQWLGAPASTDIHSNPLVRSYPEFIDPRCSSWIMHRAKGRLTRALVYDSSIRETTTHHSRTNTAAVFNLLETDFICVLVQSRMADCLGLPFRNFEAMTVLHYSVGEQLTEHFDFVDPNVPNYEMHIRERGQRVVTFLAYLNDDYAGGETEFPRLGISHRGHSGEGFFFVNAFADGKPDVRTLHAGRAPSSGEKWIISQFIKNQPAF